MGSVFSRRPWAYTTAMDPDDRRALTFSASILGACCLPLIIRFLTDMYIPPLAMALLTGVACWCVLRIATIVVTRRIVDRASRRASVFPILTLSTVPVAIVATPAIMSIIVLSTVMALYLVTMGFVGSRIVTDPVNGLKSAWSMEGSILQWMSIAFISVIVAWASGISWIAVDQEVGRVGFGRIEETMSTSIVSAILLISMTLLLQALRNSALTKFIQNKLYQLSETM